MKIRLSRKIVGHEIVYHPVNSSREYNGIIVAYDRTVDPDFVSVYCLQKRKLFDVHRDDIVCIGEIVRLRNEIKL